MSWHARSETLAAYVRGEVDEATAYSLDAHVLACAPCRHEVAGRTARAPLDRIWRGIDSQLEMIRPGRIERLLLRLGTGDHVARVLAATPSLRLSWLAAIALVLGFAGMAAHSGDAGLLFFLVLAPLVPLAGVAAAYGPGLDPTYEIGLAAPMRSFRLLLIRSVAVLATSVVLAGAAALPLPGLDWRAAAWLIPALGLTTTSLALSTFVRPLWAAGGTAFVWVMAVTVVEGLSELPLATFRLAGQLAALACLAVGVIALAARRDSFEQRRRV